MAAGSECKWIFIDHIHMISAAGGDNETAEINKIMHKFRDLCEELNICIVTVSHLRRLDGNKGHENGAEVNLSHPHTGRLEECDDSDLEFNSKESLI